MELILGPKSAPFSKLYWSVVTDNESDSGRRIILIILVVGIQKFAARIASKDIRSTTARNLRLLEEETGGMTWSNSKQKIQEMLLQGVPGAPKADEWRITYLGKLLEQRDIMKYQGLEESEPAQLVQSLINSLCST